MLFLANVLRWQCDGWKRVRATTGTSILLNTNRLSDMRDVTDGTSLFYFDNPLDYRDNGHWMLISDHAVADMIVHMNTALNHNTITIPVYHNNDPTLTTANVDIPVADITYAIADDNHPTRSWLYGTWKAWDYTGVLINLSLAQILALV